MQILLNVVEILLKIMKSNFKSILYFNLDFIFRRKSQSVALITAYQVFAGVKEKTEAATTFYTQLFALIRALDKSVGGMEDTCKKLYFIIIL